MRWEPSTSGVLSVSSCSSSTAIDVVSDVMDLFAVLISHNGAIGSSGISTQNNTTLPKSAAHKDGTHLASHTNNGCTSFHRTRHLESGTCEKIISGS